MKEEHYSAIRESVEGVRKVINAQIRIIEISQETYKNRLDPNTFSRVSPPGQHPQSIATFENSAIAQADNKLVDSSQGSDSRLISQWPSSRPAGGIRDKPSDVSIVANESDGEEEGGSGEEEDDAPETLRISNSNFHNNGALFVVPSSPMSRNKIGLQKRYLDYSEPTRRIFLKHKVTALSKNPGDDNGNMALWVGGPKQLICLMRNEMPMQSLELDPLNTPANARHFTSHICYLDSHMIFFTSSYQLIVMNLSGKVEFVTDIGIIFNRTDYVVCSLSDWNSRCLILGTNEGKFQVIEIDLEDKSINPAYDQLHSARKISSMTWLNEEEKTFFYSTIDRSCGVVRFESKDSLVTLRIFNYKYPINTSIRMGKLIVAAYNNGHISIIEPTKGEVLISMQPARATVPKPSEFNAVSANWLGYFFVGNNEEFNEYLEKDFRGEPEEFGEFLTKVKFICKYDDGSLVLFGYPSEDRDVLEMNVTGSSATHASSCESRRLPVVLERFGDRSVCLRMFSIEKEMGAQDGDVHKDKHNDNATFMTWLIETEIFFNNSIEN